MATKWPVNESISDFHVIMMTQKMSSHWTAPVFPRETLSTWTRPLSSSATKPERRCSIQTRIWGLWMRRSSQKITQKPLPQFIDYQNPVKLPRSRQFPKPGRVLKLSCSTILWTWTCPRAFWVMSSTYQRRRPWSAWPMCGASVTWSKTAKIKTISKARKF